VELGRIISNKKCESVYGGGSIGLMGIIADTVIMHHGRVTGVIPKFLYDSEVGHDEVTHLIIVKSMHERKQKMAKLSDAFIALPGGIGTLEELFEIFTWQQLKLVDKPVGLLNVNGYYDDLISFLDRSVQDGFLKPEAREKLIVSDNPEELFELLDEVTVKGNGNNLEKI